MSPNLEMAAQNQLGNNTYTCKSCQLGKDNLEEAQLMSW